MRCGSETGRPPYFFKAEHRKIAAKLCAEPEEVADNMHEACGETGAIHSLVIFVSALEKANPGDWIVLAGFGQGYDALHFQVTENIRNLAARNGIRGSLENKKSVDQYLKFLKFRELIQTEMGIRAEKPAYIKSFTGDLLAVSVDPPAIYGMIQFDEGGRRRDSRKLKLLTQL